MGNVDNNNVENESVEKKETPAANEPQSEVTPSAAEPEVVQETPAAESAPASAEVSVESASAASQEFVTFITPFAREVGKGVDEVVTALSGVIGENPGAEAIGYLQSEEDTPFSEIKDALSGVPLAKLRSAIRKLRKVQGVDAPSGQGAASISLLPQVMPDESFIQILKAGGELKVDQVAVISALRAALAGGAGIYDLPKILSERMEKHAEDLDDPVGPEFFELRELLTKRSYAEIFAAIPGLKGNFVTETRKKDLLSKMGNLWTSLSNFHQRVNSWMEEWQNRCNNPAVFAQMLTGVLGRGGSPMPQGMNEAPDVSPLRDAAESVVVQINKVFSGVGIPVARALAYDAQNIKSVLENPTLPTQIGAANKEQMLKMLGVDVTSDYVRLEQDITRYALGILNVPQVSSDLETHYFNELYNLGNRVPWDTLLAKSF